jgi:hypothetical protein
MSNNYKDFEDFVKIFKVTIPIYNDNPKKHFKEVLKTAFRQVEKISIKCISKEAKKQAEIMGIDNLMKYTWDDQVKKMKDDKRKIFHWEHYYPVTQQISDMLNLYKKGAFEAEDIYSIVSRTRICWITKKENKRLDYKNKSLRPDPEKAYKDAEIELICDFEYKK